MQHLTAKAIPRFGWSKHPTLISDLSDLPFLSNRPGYRLVFFLVPLGCGIVDIKVGQKRLTERIKMSWNRAVMKFPCIARCRACGWESQGHSLLLNQTHFLKLYHIVWINLYFYSMFSKEWYFTENLLTDTSVMFLLLVHIISSLFEM